MIAVGAEHLAYATSGQGASLHRRSHVYDSLGRLSRIEHQIAGDLDGAMGTFAETSGFDALGNVSSKVWTTPDTTFRLDYSRDAHGNLLTISGMVSDRIQHVQRLQSGPRSDDFG